jgi:hypothetical protein
MVSWRPDHRRAQFLADGPFYQMGRVRHCESRRRARQLGVSGIRNRWACRSREQYRLAEGSERRIGPGVGCRRNCLPDLREIAGSKSPFQPERIGAATGTRIDKLFVFTLRGLNRRWPSIKIDVEPIALAKRSLTWRGFYLFRTPKLRYG